MDLLSVTFFIGRFHPVIVHLPIGFILLAVIIEWRLKDLKASKAVTYAWLLSAISSGLAALMGWFLANEGAYDNWTLFAHRWLGIFIGIFSLYAWYIRREQTPSKLMRRVTNIGSIIILLVTGHLGGNMTHGSDYLLEHAPKPIQSLLGYGASSEAYPQYSNPDSVAVYTDLVMPTLERKCWSCHNDEVQNGGLNMSSIEALMAGGDGGPSVVAGDIGSELIRRVTLPPSSSKFMPTSGTAMTYHEIKLLEWWIAQGADPTAKASEVPAGASVQRTLLDLFGLDLTPRPWIEKTKVAPPTDKALGAVHATGLNATLLSSDNGWVEVSLPYGKEITNDQISTLSNIGDQITSLKASNANLSDDQLKEVANLSNLTTLKLDGNPITSSGAAYLQELNHLEVINLVNTEVDDEIFHILDNLPRLSTIYLWQSNVTEEGVAEARKKFTAVDIIVGVD